MKEANRRVDAVLERARAALEPGQQFDVFVVSALPNVRYLSGFTGSNGLLAVAPGFTLLLTDPRYALQAPNEASCEVRIAKGNITQALLALIKSKKWKRIAVERNRISYETYEVLAAALPAPARLLTLDGVVETVRMIKDADEIQRIRRSVETNSRAYRRAMKSFRPGMRETELAAEIDYQQRRAGAEASAFSTIVASGARSALPHAQPSHEKITGKGPLLIDMGACEEGYTSDMTRTSHVGKAPKRFRGVYRAVLEAQLAAIDRLRPGVTAGQVDAAARGVLTRAGFRSEFVHSTGHGLGLEIHELPRIGAKSATVLEAGFVVTVEPGAYIEGFGGVRIEDTVLVTEKGAEVLTPTSKSLAEM